MFFVRLEAKELTYFTLILVICSCQANAYVGDACEIPIPHGVGDGKPIGLTSSQMDLIGLCACFVVKNAFSCRAVTFVEDVEVDAVGAHWSSHLHDFLNRIGLDNGKCFLIHFLWFRPPMTGVRMYRGVLHNERKSGVVNSSIAHGVRYFLQSRTQLEVAIGVCVRAANREKQFRIKRFFLHGYIYK